MPTPPFPWSGDPDRSEPARRPPHGTNALLFETTRGRVEECACCGTLELRFGNALLSVAAAELGHLRETLTEVEAGAADASQRRGRSADRPTVLTLNDSGCGWVFDADEIAELHRLVAGAALLLELKSTKADRPAPPPDGQQARGPASRRPPVGRDGTPQAPHDAPRSDAPPAPPPA